MVDASALQGANRNAYEYLNNLFTSYGLGTLAPVILNFVQQGYSNDTVAILLQDTPEYKTRFAANDKRRAAGLPVLAPNEYLALENSYRQTMAYYGMPKGFYDSNSDFTDWIAGDVSPKEIESRVQLAFKYVNNSDPSTKQALQDYYGVDEAHIAAYFLDQKKAAPLLERQSQAVSLGAAANRQGLSLSKDRAQMFADQGAAANAEQSYSTIGQILPDAQKLGQIYNQDYTQADAENEVLGGLASARRKRQKLAGQEVSSFSGNAGVGNKSLGKRTAGAY